MRRTTIGLASLLLPTIMGAFVVTGCGEDGLGAVPTGEELCGPCGAVVTGDVGISGNAKLDGFFSAVSDLNKASVSINADFEANIGELMTAFGLEASGDIQADVDDLVAEIEAEITANASGGLKVVYAGPKCEANISVSVDAQASCEAKAGCEVMADPGEVSVECEGKCEGSCSAECSGGFKCDFSAGAACMGKCEGSCTLEVAAACEGTCKGTCSGECSAMDGQGNCAGTCEGDCEGTCELAGAAECSGTCTGSCEVMAEADCDGEPVQCSGECSGECSGGCTGSATPPSASANCEASADCQAQAKAQASANVECTPPRLELAFEFTGDVTAQASFSAKMLALQTKGVAILQGFAKYEALITGEVNGEVAFDPSPLVVVQGELEAVINVGIEGDLFADIPPGRIGCVIPAMLGSVELLGAIAADATASLEAQATFAGALTGGFSG